MNVVATYHQNCTDGTAAAAVLLRKFPEAALFPLFHSYTAADIAPALAAATPGTVVYTLDCGLGAREFLAAGHTVTTLDHHIGSKEEFEALATEFTTYIYIFDNDKSGATVTWAHFFPQEPLPELLTYVEDGDLARFTFGQDTKDATNYAAMFRDKPAEMLRLFSASIADIKAAGRTISTYIDTQVAVQIALPPLTLRVGAHTVPAYNITVHDSASGNILSATLGKAVVMFIIKGDRVKLSFRSKQGQEPTSLALATALGGGGHVHAAGANVSLKEFLALLA